MPDTPNGTDGSSSRKVAVIIPAYAAADWIIECLASVEAQKAPGWEIDVRVGVDGCEATATVLRRAGRAFYESRVNVGAYVMRNSLIGLGAADAYAMFDADDVMTEGYLAALLAALDGAGGIVAPFKREADVDLNHMKAPSRARGVHLFGSDVLRAVGGYLPHRVSMDGDLIERAASLNFSRTFVERAVFLRRLHADSLTGAAATGYRSAERRRIKRLAEKERKRGRLKIEPETTPLTRRTPGDVAPAAVDLVYTLGSGSRYGDWEFKTSVKSFVNRVDGLGRVFVVGAAPPKVDGINVTHIPCDDDPAWPADRNIARKILKACADAAISDPFLMAHDDHFVVGRFVASETPFWRRSKYGTTSRSSAYRARVDETLNVLRRLGVENPIFYDCHAPMLIHKSDYVAAMNKADWRKRDLLCKSVYGNLSDKVVPARFVDCKAGDLKSGLASRVIVSTRNQVSPALRKWLSRRASGDDAGTTAKSGVVAKAPPTKIRRMGYAEYMRKVVGRDPRRRR